MAQVWRQRERGRPFFLHLLVLLARYGGRDVGRALLYPVVLYFFLTAPRARRASREFLGRVNGRPPRSAAIFHHLYTFATTLLDRVFLFSGHHAVLDVRVHNREILLRAAEHGGCLMMTSHLGSFEVMRVIGRKQFGFPIRMVMDRRPGAMLEAVLKRFDPDISDAIIDRSRGQLDCMLRIREALAARDWVGIMADRAEPGERSVQCSFMGRTAPFPLAPWLLAGSLGVPVVLCVGLYRGGNRYDLYFEQVTEAVRLAHGQREQEAARWARRYAERLSEYARSAPDNWFNFYPFWGEGTLSPGARP